MSKPPVDLSEWIAAARAGSDEALGESLEACRAYLLLVAGRELDHDLVAKGGASDLVQETFLEAQRDFRQFNGVTEAEFLGWLRKILLHNLANFRRTYRQTDKRKIAKEVAIDSDRSSRDLRAVLQAGISSPSSHAIHNEERAAIESALRSLPETYKQVIVFRNREGYSFEKIGELMGRSANAARKLWSRAIERLQRQLESSNESQ